MSAVQSKLPELEIVFAQKMEYLQPCKQWFLINGEHII